MPLRISIDPHDSLDNLEKIILNKMAIHLNEVFLRASYGIRRKIGQVCDSLIAGTDEYRSLLTGQLLGELGVPGIKEHLDHILETIANGVIVDVNPIKVVRNQFVGGIDVKMIPSDYIDILGLSDASYVTEKGVNIPWLDWLLTQGSRIIVIGYDVKLNLSSAERNRSRTGLGLMKHGQGWRVPPQWSGMPGDNFLTRAFDMANVEDMFANVFEQEIGSRL